MSADARMDWNDRLVDQLEWHWTYQLWPRLETLTDQEYLWEPVPGCWSLRPAADPGPVPTWGAGTHRIERTREELDPAPVTTIAWRLAHMIVEVLGNRVHAHFGGPPVSFDSFEYAGTAAEALNQLADMYGAWTRGVRGLGVDGLERPCGPAEGPFAEAPLAALVLHINREMLHHGAEVSLLRDLYRWQPG